MANVLNRTTRAYLQSVNTPDYDTLEWVINPDVSALVGVPSRYWDIGADDVITEMTPEQKAIVDAAMPMNTSVFRKKTYPFSLRHAKVKNMYLDWNTISTAPPGGAVLIGQKMFISAASLQIAAPVAANITLSIRVNDSVISVYDIVVPAGSNHFMVPGLNIALSNGDRLQTYIVSAVTVVNPIAQIEISWSE